MSGDLALGIDVGTSGVRVSALDAQAQEVAHAAADMTEFGGDLRDPEVWRHALLASLHQLVAELDSARIGAVAVDGTSGTVLGLDPAGKPVGTALMYNDAVDDPAIPAAIGKVAPRESAAHGAASALARAIVLQDRPGVVAIVHQADWIAGLLAGRPVASDESNALKTGYDPVKRCWPDWLQQTPLRSGLLPDVVAAGTFTGRTDGGYGLPAGAKLVAGVTDGCASFLATGADAPGDAVTALGTTLTLKLLSDTPIFAPEYGIYSHRIGERWLAGGASNTGGGVLAAFFTSDEIERLSATIDPATDSGLDYYPLNTPGERFPINDPAFAPRLDPKPDNPANLLHGLLEGIARVEALGYNRLAELGAPPLRSVRSVGGGASNPIWMALRARLLNVPMEKAASTAAAAGVARLALAHLR